MNKINKGYTLTVTSYENDGDYPNTESKTLATLEEAKVWNEMMQLCKSNILGNTYDDFNNKQKKIAKEFIKKHHKILLPDNDIESNEDNLVDWFCDLASELLGRVS